MRKFASKMRHKPGNCLHGASNDVQLNVLTVDEFTMDVCKKNKSMTGYVLVVFITDFNLFICDDMKSLV